MGEQFIEYKENNLLIVGSKNIFDAIQ